MIRDLRLRYRQTYLGVGWAVLQPLIPMLIFAAIFSRFGLETDGIPYRLFVFSGLTVWIFMGNAVTNASPVFVNNFQMITKVYFPRAFLPAAVAGALAVDGLVALTMLLGLCAWWGYGPHLSWLLLPVVEAAALLVAMTAAVAAASLTAVMRDLRNAVPALVQMWLYASPVIYPVRQIPEPVRAWAALNPVTGVLEAFRACLFGRQPDWNLIAGSAVAFGVMAACTAWAFHRLEADLAERI